MVSLVEAQIRPPPDRDFVVDDFRENRPAIPIAFNAEREVLQMSRGQLRPLVVVATLMAIAALLLTRPLLDQSTRFKKAKCLDHAMCRKQLAPTEQDGDRRQGRPIPARRQESSARYGCACDGMNGQGTGVDGAAGFEPAVRGTKNRCLTNLATLQNETAPARDQ